LTVDEIIIYLIAQAQDERLALVSVDARCDDRARLRAYACARGGDA
jgi:hypothetical protein